MTTTTTLKGRIAAALERSSMGPGHIGEVLEALDPIITEVTEVTDEHRDRANRLAREAADRADDEDTRRKAAVVAAFRDAARDWAEEDDDNSAEDLLPDYRSIRARAAHNRARQIEDGEIDL